MNDIIHSRTNCTYNVTYINCNWIAKCMNFPHAPLLDVGNSVIQTGILTLWFISKYKNMLF